MVRLILAREELRADEFTKFQVNIIIIIIKIVSVLKDRIVIKSWSKLLIGGLDVEQEILRQQSESRSEGRDRQLSGVHSISQDSCKRAYEGGSPSGPGTFGDHSERVGLSGACCFRNNNGIKY